MFPLTSKILQKAWEQVIAKSSIVSYILIEKLYKKVWSICVGKKFTGWSDDSEVSSRGEIGNIVKIHLNLMKVIFVLKEI